ncbi:hypothetical protein [Lyngbya sp. PCC 8106]|uniref:hypothetical protein n=1 Tax=Lyngbya sp. (strain PCC 8106) TaxID=313612 RepID=UPI0000EAB606|nr:hypothetical protein [Lyngbya sp. PCC 8106]EAW36012.1 hypothetical protein L8106_22491 [Lyngbya sp. PCC 8106]
MRRPTNVTIIAILQVISGIFNLVDCFIWLLIGGVGGVIVSAIGGSGLAAIFGGFFIIFASISLALGLMSFVLSLSLLQLRGWAWIGTVIVHIVALMMEVTKLLGSGGVAVNYLTVGFAIVILYYLMRPEVKQAFRV